VDGPIPKSKAKGGGKGRRSWGGKREELHKTRDGREKKCKELGYLRKISKQKRMKKRRRDQKS